METYGLEKLGILNPSAVYRNLGPAQLTEAAPPPGRGEAEQHRRAGGHHRQVHRPLP